MADLFVNAQRKQDSPNFLLPEEVVRRSGTLDLCLQCHPLSRGPAFIPRLFLQYPMFSLAAVILERW